MKNLRTDSHAVAVPTPPWRRAARTTSMTVAATVPTAPRGAVERPDDSRGAVHPARRSRGVAGAIAAIAPAVVLVVAMVAAVNLAIPNLQGGHLHASASSIAWIVDSYTLVFACLLIPAGALGDRFGRKRGMLAGLGLFAVGSAAAALAPSVGVLMGARALSGVGAALVLPATLAATLARVAPAQRPHAVALWSALSGVGGALGNLGGGIAVDLGGWRALFWAGVPLALAAAGLVAARVPAAAPAHRDRVDAGGGALLMAGTVALLYGVIEAPQIGWGSWQVIASALAAVVLLGAFTAYELRVAHPMLDPRLFGLTGVRAGALGIVALFFALFGLFYVNSQYLQDVKGYSPVLAGVCILPLAAAMPLTSARSTRLAERIGTAATAVLGMLLLAAGFGALSFATVATPYGAYAVVLAAIGAGAGLAMPPLSGTMVHALPPAKAGVGSGLNGTTRELGSALGIAVFGSIVTSHFAHHLPAAAQHVPGARGEAIRHSVTSALHYATASADGPALVHATRDAFSGATALGLRVGAVLVLLAAAYVGRQLRNH